MEDMKDKVKGFMKKVNNPFASSSSGKFKGQGRVLGSSSSGSTYPIPSRHSQLVDSSSSSNPPPVASKISNKPSVASKISNPPAPRTPTSERNSSGNQEGSSTNRGNTTGFNPYDSLITSGNRNKNGYSLNVFECPICNTAFVSEEEVSIHIESCVTNPSKDNVCVDGVVLGSEDDNENGVQVLTDKLEACIGSYLSGKPSDRSVDVLHRLLRNIIGEPENGKFRRIRMSNPKIKEAIGEVVGGIELLECIGFELKEEEGEIWAVMDIPSEENILLLRKSVSLLEPQRIGHSTSLGSVKEAEQIEPKKDNLISDEQVEPKVIDRQIRVFFSVPESVAAKIELPDSFYDRSVDEVKREAELRKKKIAESQLLIPKSYKEKQAKAARRRYTKTVIRVQFPDKVVLQGIFYPWEPTRILYEFVSSALKQPGLEFELLHPLPVRRLIPCFPAAGEKEPTFEDEELVPSALR
ncbi:hypothetical protein Nepgr_028108 [Nepenthes gracilis]|uniref:UBX domain-containing protein n=1 Tax=Nepenthes gracilis TaxID=150966 RepID=A0AAD3Y3M0_NEPGR|nr:hypothetical protein Nepgr_028108 [Nepenthes gracilis]